MRVRTGPGYRLYFAKRGEAYILLLCGGDKASQSRDIEKAIELAKEVRMPVHATPFDATDHLRSDLDCRYFLEAALDDPDDQDFEDAINLIVAARKRHDLPPIPVGDGREKPNPVETSCALGLRIALVPAQ